MNFIRRILWNLGLAPGGITSYNQAAETYIEPDILLKYVQEGLLPKKENLSCLDEVWPGLYIGDIYVAENLQEMHYQGFTHVLNCAHGPCHNGDIYKKTGIKYMGIPAQNQPSYDISVHFKTANKFIHSALKRGGKVLVHCRSGTNGSATIVLAYLMVKQKMTLIRAINTVKVKRGIYPQEYFLKQLINLHINLYGY